MSLPFLIQMVAILVLMGADVWFLRELRRERAIRTALESRRQFPVVTAWCKCTDGPFRNLHLHAFRVCGKPVLVGQGEEACGRYPGHGGPCSGLRGIEGPNTRHTAGRSHARPAGVLPSPGIQTPGGE